MKLLSSRWTFVMKRIFPLVWWGILAVVFFVDQFSGPDRGDPTTWLFCGAMLVFGCILFRLLLWNLADEVQDCGNYLMVRRGSVQERVELSSIMNVSTGESANSRRVTLQLRTGGALGDRVVFIRKSPFRLNPFASDPDADDLVRRIDRIRAQAKA